MPRAARAPRSNQCGFSPARHALAQMRAGSGRAHQGSTYRCVSRASSRYVAAFSRALGRDDTRISASRALTIAARFAELVLALYPRPADTCSFERVRREVPTMGGRSRTKAAPKGREPRSPTPTRREQQLEFAINNVSQGVCMYDADARLILCNQRYIDMYALSADVVKPGCSLEE